ncbi:MAG: TVP38/TMEM64 family protein [Verrucomicrobiota bacterium]
MLKITRAVIFQLLCILLIAGCVVWATRHFPVVEMITRAQHKVGLMKWWSAVLYPLLLAGCNILLLPGGVLAVGSGLFFGLWWGFFLILVGNVGGAAVSFWISRKLGREWVRKKIFRHQKWMALDDAISREGWKIIFLSQVHPLFPTSFINYLYGVTKIKFTTCMLWIAIGQTPGLFLYAYLGTLAQLGFKLYERKTHPHPIEYMIWFGGLVLTLVVTTALGRLALRLLREIDPPVKPDLDSQPPDPPTL